LTVAFSRIRWSTVIGDGLPRIVEPGVNRPSELFSRMLSSPAVTAPCQSSRPRVMS
jgi:hypothetical protein